MVFLSSARDTNTEFSFFLHCFTSGSQNGRAQPGCYEADLLQSFAIWIYTIDPLCVPWPLLTTVACAVCSHATITYSSITTLIFAPGH